MRGIATHAQEMHATTSVAVGMQGATKAMAAMNKQMDPANQAKIMMEFQKQSALMDMTTEMMSDTIDDALDNDEAEEETDKLTNQVLDEIGIDIASQLSAAPKNKIAGKKAEGTDSSGVDELEKRLELSEIIEPVNANILVELIFDYFRIVFFFKRWGFNVDMIVTSLLLHFVSNHVNYLNLNVVKL